jgi:hypothetical protein
MSTLDPIFIAQSVPHGPPGPIVRAKLNAHLALAAGDPQRHMTVSRNILEQDRS